MGGEWGAGKKIKKEKSNKTQTLSTDPPISPPLLFLFCTLFFLHSFRAILLGMFTLFSAVLFRFCFFFRCPFCWKNLENWNYELDFGCICVVAGPEIKELQQTAAKASTISSQMLFAKLFSYSQERKKESKRENRRTPVERRTENGF